MFHRGFKLFCINSLDSACPQNDWLRVFSGRPKEVPLLKKVRVATRCGFNKDLTKDSLFTCAEAEYAFGKGSKSPILKIERGGPPWQLT